MLHDRRADDKQKSLNCAALSSLVISNLDQGNFSLLPGESVSSLGSFSVMPEKKDEPEASQSCYSFELQEEVKKLREQLRKIEVEIQQLKDEQRLLLLFKGASLKRQLGLCTVLILL